MDSISMKLKEDFDNLEERVLSVLREAVKNSKIESKHTHTKAIKVNVFDYTELAIVNDDLTFLNSDGLHYRIYCECSLEDLIDILTLL